MTETLFVLTVIFVAYVFYVVACDKKTRGKSTTPEIEPEQKTVSVEYPPEPVLKKEQPKTTKVKQATVAKTTSTEKPVATAQNVQKKGLKNPKTGEIATTYTNYIFTKRWIKEALVAEGLLEKIYKNNELNTETETAIKSAIAKLETMEQYKV